MESRDNPHRGQGQRGSLIQELKRPVPVGSDELALHASMPISPIEPEVDKYTRAVAVTPIPEAGLVWLPDKTMPASPRAPEGYGWVDAYERELPAGKLNDRVDTFVHRLTYLRGHGSIIDFYRRLEQHLRPWTWRRKRKRTVVRRRR